MALLKYFAQSKKNLPDPNGPLSRTVPATAIVAANMAVSIPKAIIIALTAHKLGRRKYHLLIGITCCTWYNMSYLLMVLLSHSTNISHSRSYFSSVFHNSYPTVQSSSLSSYIMQTLGSLPPIRSLTVDLQKLSYCELKMWLP